MRKTRLVILPGARCLTQMCCLLLYLSCPNIGALSREKLDISRDDLYSQSFPEFKGKTEHLSKGEGMCYIDKSRINCEDNYLGNHNDTGTCFEVLASSKKDLSYGNKERSGMIISTKGLPYQHIVEQPDDRRLLLKYHRIRANSEITTQKKIRYFENRAVNQGERNSKVVEPMFNRQITARLDNKRFSKESVRKSTEHYTREILNVDNMKLNDDRNSPLVFKQTSQLKTKSDKRKQSSHSSKTSISGRTVTRSGNNLTNKRDQEIQHVPSELSNHQSNIARLSGRRDVLERDIHRISEQRDNKYLNRKKRNIERQSGERLDSSSSHSQEIRINRGSLESEVRRNTEGNSHRRLSREEKRTPRNFNFRYLESRNDERFSDIRLYKHLNRQVRDTRGNSVMGSLERGRIERFDDARLSQEVRIRRVSPEFEAQRISEQSNQKSLNQREESARRGSATRSLNRQNVGQTDIGRRLNRESNIRQIPSDFEAHKIIEQTENRHINLQERNALRDSNMRSLDRRSVKRNDDRRLTGKSNIRRISLESDARRFIEQTDFRRFNQQERNAQQDFTTRSLDRRGVEQTDNRRLIRDSSIRRSSPEFEIRYVTENIDNRRLKHRERNPPSDSTIRFHDRRDVERSDGRRLSPEWTIRRSSSESEIHYVTNKNENRRLNKRERNTRKDFIVRSLDQQSVEQLSERRLSREGTMTRVSPVIKNKHNFGQINSKPFSRQVRDSTVGPFERETTEQFDGRKPSQEFRIRRNSPESETRRITDQINNRRLNQRDGNVMRDSTVHTLDRRGVERTDNRRLIQEPSIRRIPLESDNRRITEQTERRHVNQHAKDTRRDAASRSFDHRTIERLDNRKLSREISVRRSSPIYETPISKYLNSHRLSNQESGARRDSAVPALVRRTIERFDNENKIRKFIIRHVLLEDNFQRNTMAPQSISRSEQIRETRKDITIRSPDRRTLERLNNRRHSFETGSYLSLKRDTYRTDKHLSMGSNEDQRRVEHTSNLDIPRQTQRTRVESEINKYKTRKNGVERNNKNIFVEQSGRRQNNEGQESRSLSQESSRFRDSLRNTELVENKRLNKEDRNTRKVQISDRQREFEHLENRRRSEETRSHISFKQDSRRSVASVDDRLFKRVKRDSRQISATIRSRDYRFDDNRRLYREINRLDEQNRNSFEKLEKRFSSQMETDIKQILAERSDIRYVNGKKVPRQPDEWKISVVSEPRHRFEKLHQSMKDTQQVSLLRLHSQRRMGLRTRMMLDSNIRRNSAERDTEERNKERKNGELRNETELRFIENRIRTRITEKPNQKMLTREFVRHAPTNRDNRRSFERFNDREPLRRRDTLFTAAKHSYSHSTGKRLSNYRFFGMLDLSHELAGIRHGIATLAKLNINYQITDISNNRLTSWKLPTLQIPRNFEMGHIVKTPGDNLRFIQDRREIMPLNSTTNSKSNENEINGNVTSSENKTEMSNEASIIFQDLSNLEISLSKLKEELKIYPGAIDTEENLSSKQNYVSEFIQNLFSSVWSMKEETKAALVGSVACILLTSNVK
ncbi:uncharacterized protein LOC142330260 [Lycorma delicatula]|uniref:uncharacterized protein LOC142330260 n=1 Tax=Lycorma delicatula TaxID=130591 RepID=UPI003F516B5C